MFFLDLTLTGCDCGGAGVLKIIKFIWQLLDIVLFLVPMGLIIMVTVDFAKNVISGKDDEMKKNVNIAIKRIIYAAVLFLIPTIVDFSMKTLANIGIDYANCITIAQEQDLSQYEDCEMFESLNTNTTTSYSSAENYGNNTSTIKSTNYTFKNNSQQPKYVNNEELKKSGKTVADVEILLEVFNIYDENGTIKNLNVYNQLKKQNIWKTDSGKYYVWEGKTVYGENESKYRYIDVTTYTTYINN